MQKLTRKKFLLFIQIKLRSVKKIFAPLLENIKNLLHIESAEKV
jgi:hypothetical protein